jgi:large subunit ribosomal protein L20
MTRVKRGATATKKREKLLKKTKGFKWRRKSTERAAREALLHALPRKFKGRKEKKRVNRGIWQSQIGAAVKKEGLAYSKFIGALKKKNVLIDRKILSEIAIKDPETFHKIVEFIK